MTDQKSRLTKTSYVFAGAFFCCALWGSAYPCVKTGYRLMEIASGDQASQILFAGERFFLAGILTLVFGSFGSRKILFPKGSEWFRVGILSLLQTILNYFFFYIGLANTSGVNASILGSVSGLFAVLLSVFVFRMEKLNVQKAAGCLIGFLGILVLNLGGGASVGSFRLTGEGFLIFASLSYAASSVVVRIFSRTDDPVMLCGWQFIVGGLVLAALGYLGGGRLKAYAPGSFMLLLYMAFISAAAYSIWSILLKYNPVSRVSVFGFLNPVCGVILSALILNEADQLGPRCICALALVVCGIILVNKGQEK